MSEHDLAQDVATENIVSKFLSQRTAPASDPPPASPTPNGNGNRQFNREVKVGLGVLAVLLGALAAVVTLRSSGRLPDFLGDKKPKLPAPLSTQLAGHESTAPAIVPAPESPAEAAARRFAIQAYGTAESAADDGAAHGSAVAPASAALPINAVPLDAEPQSPGDSPWNQHAPEQLPTGSTAPEAEYPAAPTEDPAAAEQGDPLEPATDEPSAAVPPADPFAPPTADPFADSAPRALPVQPSEPLSTDGAGYAADDEAAPIEDQANPFATDSAVQPAAAAEPVADDAQAYSDAPADNAPYDPAAQDATPLYADEPYADQPPAESASDPASAEPPLRYDMNEDPSVSHAADPRYPDQAYDPQVQPAEAVDRAPPHVAAAPRRGERAARRSPRAVAQAPTGQEPAPPEVQAAQGRYTIEPQDNYWRISQKLYGTGRYFKALYEHNKPRFPRSDQLRLGDEILAPPAAELERLYPDLCPPAQPAADPSAPAGQYRHARTSEAVTRPRAGAGEREYTVAEGDTLFDIARYELGKASRWIDIYELNRDQLGENVNLLRPGMTLLLPDEAGTAPVTVQQPGPRRR